MNGIKQMGNMILSVESFCSSSIPLIDPLLDPRSGSTPPRGSLALALEFSKSGIQQSLPMNTKNTPMNTPTDKNVGWVQSMRSICLFEAIRSLMSYSSSTEDLESVIIRVFVDMNGQLELCYDVCCA